MSKKSDKKKLSKAKEKMEFALLNYQYSVAYGCGPKDGGCISRDRTKYENAEKNYNKIRIEVTGIL